MVKYLFVKPVLLIAMLMSGAFFTGTSLAKPLRFYSEVSPPYLDLDKNGQYRGVNYELAQALMAETGLSGKFEHLNWARALEEAKVKDDIILMSLARSKSREKDYQWLGHIDLAKASLLTLPHHPLVTLCDLEQAKPFRVGSVRGYATAKYLLAQGFKENENLILVSNTNQLWSMLYLGRIDIAVSNIVTAPVEVKMLGLDAKQLIRLMDLPGLQLELQMATGLKTDINTAAALSQGLAKLKEKGIYQQIMAKWGLLQHQISFFQPEL